MQFPGAERLVCDHHQLVRDGSEESFPHVNPLLDGLSGEELSGAGCAYLVAAALDARNLDLLPLALVGASADLQDRKTGSFHGANAALLAHGEAAGLLSSQRDLAFFGPETRPLRKFLALAEPAVPTATGSQRTAEAFLLSLGIPLQDDAGERTWARLTPEERTRVRSALVDRLVDTGLAQREARLWRTVVTLAGERPGPTRESQEFGTLLNGTARYGRPEVGLAVARGDRGAAYEEALGLLLDHRKHLAGALDALARRGVSELLAVQWTHLEDQVLDTVVGIVCGMALDGLGLRRDLALVAFAWTPDGRTKASSRSPHELQARGIDLAAAMRDAAAALGGQGGGHKGAAGATIPRGCEPAFIAHVDRLVAAQLGMQPAPPVGLLVHAAPTAAGAAAPAPVAGHVAAVPFLQGRGAQTRLAF
jgi:single-stranded-DNA-specific exonuclease